MRSLIIGFSVCLASCSSSQPSPEQSPSSDVEMPAAPTPPADEAGTPYSAPADPNATYTLLGVKPGRGGNIIALTRRTGPSGTSYSNREIDCGEQLARYIGEGDTREEAERPAPNPGNMAMLVEGSSTWAAVQAACEKQ